MAKVFCTTCGRPFPKQRTPTVTKPIVEMTDAELFRHYRAMAPMADLEFFLRRYPEMSAELKADASALVIDAPTLTRAEHYRRLIGLQDRWRRECNESDRRMRIAAVGTQEWRMEQIAEEMVCAS